MRAMNFDLNMCMNTKIVPRKPNSDLTHPH